jgi:regulator of protease activity HflC (stomatin/prohibitin superfamily)
MLDFLANYWPYLVAGFFVVLVVLYALCGINIVDQWERLPYKRFGVYKGTLGPGFTWLEPFSTSIIAKFDIRDNVDDLYESLHIPPGSVQTHDNVPVTFRPLLTYKVIESRAADFALNVENDYEALWQRSLTIISEFVSNTELDSILHDRQALYGRIKDALQEAVSSWGVRILAVEIKDITITDQSIQEAIAMKARAKKEGEAELERAIMQHSIAAQLSMAADAYDEAGWKLKGLETLQELCRSASNNTVIIPTDMIQTLARVMA